MKRTNKKGFTIVELVIVIAVIAILAAVLIPTFVSLTNKANMAADQQVAKNMNVALANYSAEKGAPTTFEEVLVAIEEAGYVLANLNTKANGNLYAWDKANNQIVYINAEGKVIYQNTNFNQADLQFVVANNTVTLPTWANAEAIVDMTKPTGAKFLKDALVAGGNVALGGNITVTSESAADKNVISGNTSIDFGNNILKLDLPNATGATANWRGLIIEEGTVVLSGGENGGVVTAANEELYAICVGEKYSNADNINVTIKSGKYIGGTTAVYVRNGTVTIEGGHFEATSFDEEENMYWVINCADGSYKDGTAKVIITGGTFVNFNPANNKTEGEGTNFVAEGYSVASKTVEEDTWYIVYQGDTAPEGYTPVS